MENNAINFKIKAVFNNVIKLWPEQINVECSKDNSRIFPMLSKAWDNAEDMIDDDPWEVLMVWVIYGVLHDEAVNLAKNTSGQNVYPKKLQLKKVIHEYMKQLDDEEWKCLKLEFLQQQN
ncbi:hypothetical protein OS175_04050 [Marinicella sp. S1101]|uniref:hypothetical protein n=1 Tax=Marinicella marina TaxID=2996016 RepID=UPI002260AD76|nr:hypothetical protein [Marinicella marina]MCX7553039.1 hypothetical protein [Marinicella marina]MDJ1139601.1 hypothetical protein [Marinicella marina]